GETLALTTGTWAGDAPMTYTYTWWRCDDDGCESIPGATASTYALTSSDIGYGVAGVVTATNGVGHASYWTDRSDAVVARSLSGPDPVVSGTPTVGSALTATVGAWSGSGPIGYAWTWERCSSPSDCTEIAGATADTYRPVVGDVGRQLRARVAVASQWDDAASQSALTAAVAVAAPDGATDTGSVTPGGTITVSGSNFGPHTMVTVVLHSDPVVLGSVLTDAVGSFTTTFVVPAGVPAGAHHIVLEGVDAAGNARTVSTPVTITGSAMPVGDAPGAATPGTSRAAAPAALAMTGTTVAGVVGSGLAMLLCGMCVLGVRRRRAAATVRG
ncbi:MAG: hypothetical protein ACYC2O_13450, partial [Microthrixaceae bacterium]